MSLFIPQKLKVGFRKREDTFNGKLAYVIYIDSQGKLRKEKSWNSWRDKEIDVVDLDNIPISGFMLNKGHTRYAWSSFGSNRTVIRIHDPRGIEFEITPENLVGLLMHTDCSRREIQDKLIYAWDGTELVLLPTSSIEYKDATKYTNLQGLKVSAKDLKLGATYLTKKQKVVIYLGRFFDYEWHYKYNNNSYNRERTGKKYHMFVSEDLSNFFPIKSISGTLAKCINSVCIDDYANLVDKYYADIRSSTIVEYKILPKPQSFWDDLPIIRNGYYNANCKVVYSIQDDEAVIKYGAVIIDNVRKIRPISYIYIDKIKDDSRYYCNNNENFIDINNLDISKFGDLITVYKNGVEKNESL